MPMSLCIAGDGRRGSAISLAVERPHRLGPVTLAGHRLGGDHLLWSLRRTREAEQIKTDFSAIYEVLERNRRDRERRPNALIR
jgi:hypothetical protein